MDALDMGQDYARFNPVLILGLTSPEAGQQSGSRRLESSENAGYQRSRVANVAADIGKGEPIHSHLAITRN